MAEERYRAFLAVVETGSISKAAQMMNYTQPGISHLIASLEEDLGFELFNRTKNGATLTGSGQFVLPYIKRMVQVSNILVDIARKEAELKQGRFIIGTFTDAAIHWIPELLKDFRVLHPDIRPELFTAGPKQLEEALRDGAISCALTPVMPGEDLDAVLLKEDPYYAVLPEGHPLAERTSLRPEELAAEEMIFPEGSNDHYMEIIIMATGYPPEGRLAVDDDRAAASLVRAGFGITFLTELALKGLPEEGIAKVPIEGVSRQIYFATVKDGYVSPVLSAFRSLCVTRLQDKKG